MPKNTFTDEQLAESEGRLRKGDKSALLDVLYYYIIRGVRVPIWVSVQILGKPMPRCMMVTRPVGTTCLVSLGRDGILATYEGKKTRRAYLRTCGKVEEPDNRSMRLCLRKLQRIWVSASDK